MAAAAIRIDKHEVLHGKRHIDLVTDWIMREGVSIEQADAAIEAGRIEFGCVTPGGAFFADPSRNDVYDSVDGMIHVNGISPETRKTLFDPEYSRRKPKGE